MQKFFSLFCAVLLVFSASAAPVAQKAQLVKKAPVAVEQIQKVQLEKAQVANFNQLSAAPALKVTNQKAQAPTARSSKSAKANLDKITVKAMPAKAPKAVAEDINVTALDVYFDSYYGEYDMYTEDGFYAFSGFVSTPVVGKTYTLADLDPEYTGFYTWEYEFTAATAATLTVSKKNGLPYVVGTMTLGGNNYTITYELKITQTVTINANNLTAKTHYYGGYEYTFNDATWTVDIVDFDMATKTGTLQNIDFDYSCVYPTGGSSYDADYFAAVIEDVVVAQDADTLKLTGAIAATNGILYVLNARYEKPAAKEITLEADTLKFFTTMLNAGYYTVNGYNTDSTYEFSFYFISKSITGTFTEEDMDVYSTWVDEKDGKRTVVSYQNLSEANIQVSLVKDTLYYEGTITLATNDGQEAIFTLHLSCPYKQEWGDWADFAPFDLNTGKYTLNAVFGGAVVTNVPVKVRKDNTGLKQYQFLGVGKGGYYGQTGIDMTLNMNPDNTFTVKPVGATVQTSSGFMNIILTDAYTATQAPQYAAESYYDPESGIFTIFTVALNSTATEVLTANYETMVMDKPITERDTVDVVSNKMTYYDFIATNQVVQFYAGSDAEGYTTFLVTSKNASTIEGTFDIYEGYCFADSTDGSRIGINEGQITIVKEDDVYHLTGWAIGSNEKYYRLDWTEMAGVLEYDTDAPFDATFAWSEMSTSIEDGVIGIYATNADMQSIGLELYTDPANTTIPAGTYVISDSYEAATALKSVGVVGSSLTECWAGVRAASGGIADCWFIVDGTVTLSYDEYDKLKVVVDGTNSWGQPVTALVQYEKLEPKSTVEINDAEFIVNEGYIAQYGIINFYGGNAEGDAFDLYAYSDAHVGDFVDVIDFGDCEITTPNGTVGVIDAYELQIATEDGKHLTLTAKVLGSDTIQYNITATGYYGALSYDQDEDVTMSFNLDDATMSGRGGVTTISIQNANQEVVALQVVAQLDGEKLPEGEYLINDTKESNTVIASTGVDPTTSMVSPSYVGLIEGTSLGKVWFLRSGKMTVDAKGNMTINAKNSLDRDVVVSITAGATGLIDINAAIKTNKVVRNGRLMIIKNTKVYSVLGQQIQ